MKKSWWPPACKSAELNMCSKASCPTLPEVPRRAMSEVHLRKRLSFQLIKYVERGLSTMNIEGFLINVKLVLNGSTEQWQDTYFQVSLPRLKQELKYY